MRPEAEIPGGFQIAFLVFAIIFLAYPMQKYLGPLIGIEGPHKFVSRIYIFVPLILLLALVPVFRRFSIEELGTPIPAGRRVETAAVTLLKAVLLPLAAGGAIALWYWGLRGEMGLARRVGQQEDINVSIANVLAPEGLLFLGIAVIVAPVVEELLFRGLLYRAWEARWGWFWSMLATSALFAAYHPVPFAAFASAIVYVAIYRRTGSIWAPILAHSAGNLLTSSVLMGRFYFPTKGKETGEIGLWAFHLGALALLVVLIALYVWMARDSKLRDGEEPATA